MSDSLAKSGINLKKYTGKRGYDHGVFIPLMIMYPFGNVPVIQISLLNSLDPEKHYEMGKALRQLKNNGYLILGSGASVHGGFGDPKSRLYSE